MPTAPPVAAPAVAAPLALLPAVAELPPVAAPLPPPLSDPEAPALLVGVPPDPGCAPGDEQAEARANSPAKTILTRMTTSLSDDRAELARAAALTEVRGPARLVFDGRGDQRVEQLVVRGVGGVDERALLQVAAAVAGDDVGHVLERVRRTVRDVVRPHDERLVEQAARL